MGFTPKKQIMEAIKFYYERIQGRKTMFFNLNSEYEKVDLKICNTPIASENLFNKYAMPAIIGA